LLALLFAMTVSCNSGQALRLRARFRGTDAFRPGAQVQISGVTVGAVTAINPVSGSAEEREFILDFPKPAPPIPSDARARMVRASGSDNYFVELDLANTKGRPARNDDLLPTTTELPSRTAR
jgi:ABC-type transporter Mla subunit MlaD